MVVRVLFKPRLAWSLLSTTRGLVRLGEQLVLGVVTVLVCPQLVSGQTVADQAQSVPKWQTAAGGRMEFEVASIRLEEHGKFVPPNIDLGNDDTPIPHGGPFIADFPLEKYIEFAYKIAPSRDQEEAMIAHLPKWVATDRFVIQAKAEGNPTKDQMRLMMQSLLADRFQVAVHFETREASVPALALKKPGKLGPRLRPNSEGPSCDNKLTMPADPSSPSVIPGGFVQICGVF
jgi:bla regulator protein blaR1